MKNYPQRRLIGLQSRKHPKAIRYSSASLLAVMQIMLPYLIIINPVVLQSIQLQWTASTDAAGLIRNFAPNTTNAIVAEVLTDTTAFKSSDGLH
jgi:hypothetical protein